MNKKKIRQYESMDRRYIWHPFTQMLDYERETPVIIERGKGNYLFDIHGKKYLDAISSLWVTVHGHGHAALNSALTKQLEKVAHSTLLGLSNTAAVDLAKELVVLSPKRLKKVFYSDNGSTAVEIALKMAFQYWQQKSSGMKHIEKKKKFFSFTGAYHGDTIGSVSLGGIEVFHKTYEPLLFRSTKIPYPHCYRCPYDKKRESCGLVCVKDMRRMIKKHAATHAAVIVEPLVQGAAGMVMMPDGYLFALRQACTKHHLLLIVDEVATGFGRTGKMFACQHEGVEPDLMAVAKGITGGYLPLAATLTTQQVYDAFLAPYQDLKAFFHGHTYTGNPLAAACAIENIRLFRRKRVLRNVKARARQLAELLRGVASMPYVGQVRQKGLMVGIEIVKNKEKKQLFSLEEKITQRICRRARDKGILLRPLGAVLVLMPPLSISAHEIARLVRTVKQSIEAILLGESDP